ncbi:MAG TPA: endo-1,4-beta-xylanase [Tepidisphaeraceae bacterium]|nr:endo-1,4-beta-xylanase [Tepidisphaeraceae bacterium]
MFQSLREEFSAVGPGRFIAGTTPDETVERLTSAGKVEAVEGQSFTKARKVHVPERQKFEWMTNVQLSTKEPVKAGDTLVAFVWARGKAKPKAVDTGEGAIIQAYFGADAPQFSNQLSNYHDRHRISPEWERYWFKTVDPVKKDYAPGQVRIMFMLGHEAQDVEFGPVAIMAFPKGSDVTKLPKPSYDYNGRAADAPWRAEAAKRIDQYRKGDLTVTVRDAAGQPVPNAQVKVEMKRHAFPFGTAVALPRWLGSDGMSQTDKENYRRILLDHFNMIATENSLKWAAATEWGQKLEDTEAMLRWAREHKLYTKGHVLVWPSWHHTPKAVRERTQKDPEALRKAVREHVRDYASRFRGLVDDWDVTNETEGNRDYMDILGPTEMIEWYKIAHEAAPDAKLSFAEPGLGAGGMEGGSFPEKELPQYRGWVDYLIKNGAPLHRLASQEHGGTVAKLGKKRDPSDAWKFWDDMYAKYGKPIFFTEIDVNVENDKDEEQLKYQADVLRDTLILAFAHPHVEGVNQWGFWEKAHWFPRAALWRADWSIKPNGQAYLDLVYRDWWTTETVITDPSGKASLRGFGGDYEVTIDRGGTTQTGRATVVPREANAVEIKIGS